MSKDESGGIFLSMKHFVWLLLFVWIATGCSSEASKEPKENGKPNKKMVEASTSPTKNVSEPKEVEKRVLVPAIDLQKRNYVLYENEKGKLIFLR